MSGNVGGTRLRIIGTMHGLHLMADVRGCLPSASTSDTPPAAMTDPAALRSLCLQAVAAAGLQAVGELFHRFPPPGGVTGVVLLAESHLAVHTWPELGAVTLDVYVCNMGSDNSVCAQALLSALQAAFAATTAVHHRVLRGWPGP